MRQFLATITLILTTAFGLAAGTAPIVILSDPITSPPEVAPQIDATVFVNQALLDITDPSGLPFHAMNNLFFTNEVSGTMTGSPGYRWDFFTNNVRLKMNTWVNRGTNSGTTWLLVSATNIIGTGPMSVGDSGLIRLDGNNISLPRAGLSAAALPGTIFSGGFFLGSSNYINPPGVIDLDWGAGVNNHLDNQGTPMPLNFGNFDVPNPQSPAHQVERIFSGFAFTNNAVVPGFNFLFSTNIFFGTNFVLPSYAAFVFTNQFTFTSAVVQVVFVPTNHFDPNFSTSVRFVPPFGLGAAEAIVQFNSVDFDIVSRSNVTSSVYLIDDSASTTNIFLSQNVLANTKRPSTYEVARDTPFNWDLGVGANSPFSSSLIYNSSYVSNAVTVLYAGYSAQINSPGLTNSTTGNGFFSDPTNLPGRVEILGDTVNLDKTRIRAESTVIIKAKNLASNKVAQVDAPFCNYDLTSLQPDLVITNLAPLTVRRLSGQISAWSGVWDNGQVTANGTNSIHFHVLIVENNLQSQTPVTVNEFAAHGTNIVIADLLSVGKSILLDGKSLNVTGGLSFPANVPWSASTVLNVINFTNRGLVNVPKSEKLGTDRATPYSNYVNRGTNIASSFAIRTLNFDNSGCVIATGGGISLNATVASMSAPPKVVVTNVFTNTFLLTNGQFFTQLFTNVSTNFIGAKLAAGAPIQINANVLTVSNSYISAGELDLSVTNRLSDGGQGAISDWLVSAGFQALILPTTSDLLATHITSTAPLETDIGHVWAGRDFGPVNAGYTNNLALGKLTLNVGSNSVMHFSGAGASNALYVDYLELLNYATNYNTAFAIDPSITIYFANANVPPAKLDASNNGHLRWVSSFAGPLSSTNITYPSGNTYTFNMALVRSKDLDSDGDGIANADDPTPIFVDESMALSIAMSKAQPARALLSWNALLNRRNILECKRSINDPNWVVITNFDTGPANRRVTVTDLLLDDPHRIYRVRMEAPR